MEGIYGALFRGITRECWVSIWMLVLAVGLVLLVSLKTITGDIIK